jgi:hypothetical protein
MTRRPCSRGAVLFIHVRICKRAFTATDQNGLTATSTRTIIVQAAKTTATTTGI